MNVLVTALGLFFAAGAAHCIWIHQYSGATILGLWAVCVWMHGAVWAIKVAIREKK